MLRVQLTTNINTGGIHILETHICVCFRHIQPLFKISCHWASLQVKFFLKLTYVEIEVGKLYFTNV